MSINRNKIKTKLSSISTSVSSFLIPFFQYVPCTAIWFGIMSVPLIVYLGFFFQNPEILLYDLDFLTETHGFYFVLFGFILYICSLAYQLTHRKQLIKTGPYRYIRHPQYIAFIIITLGLTLVSFETSPVFDFDILSLNGYTFILYIWIGELLAYIFLAKIEEIALKTKYGDEFIEYIDKVPFMFPFLKLKRNKSFKE
jgi:protein-S-isoprenylcysteine O-methyltransferase Ste14